MRAKLTQDISSQRGVSLMESLVSLALFLIVSVGIVGGSASFMKFNTLNEQKSAAIAATQQALDAVRVNDPATLPSSGNTSSTVPVGGRNFTVKVSYCENATYCTSGTVRHLTARASFRGVQLYQVETIYAQLQ